MQNNTAYYKDNSYLEMLREEFLDNQDDVDCAEEYIDELFQSYLDSEIDIKVALPEMERAWKQFPFSEVIAEAYAYLTVPWNLSGTELKKAVEKIHMIQRQFPENENICGDYIQSLTFLAHEQDASEIAESIVSAKLILFSFPDNDELKSYFDELQSFFTQRCQYEKAEITLINSENVVEFESEALERATALCDLLTIDVATKDYETVLRQIEELHNQFSESQDIAVVFAEALRRATWHNADEPFFSDSIEKIEKMYANYSGKEEFAEIICSIVTEAVPTTIEEMECSLSIVGRYYSRLPDNYKIQEAYACALYVYSDLGPSLEESKRMEILEQLKAFSAKHPNNKDVKEYLTDSIEAYKLDKGLEGLNEPSNTTQTVSTAFQMGDTVLHKAFGTGKVESISAFGNDCIITVIFDESGKKDLMERFANLEKLE